MKGVQRKFVRFESTTPLRSKNFLQIIPNAAFVNKNRRSLQRIQFFIYIIFFQFVK